MRLLLQGDPKPKGRPRSRVVTPKDGGKPWVQVYSDEQTASWEETVGWQVRQQLLEWTMDGTPGELVLPLSGRTLVEMRFNVNKPASTPKKVEYPLKKPDIDNLAKSVLDGLTKMGLLKDDNIVTDMNICKRYVEEGHPLGVEVEITSWTG